MPMAYSVEKLLALRDSVSESAVSIDKFADEDVIKEHVIRPSVSANLIRTASTASFEKPLRASAAAPGVAASAINLKKPSPSPSVKRGKAERLLKEHGSPPGMRVTAGGRVVPSDLPPLNGVRFGSNNVRAPRPRSVDPNTGLPRQSQTDNLSAQLRIIGTQPVIQVGDKIYPLQAYDGGYAMPSVLPTTVVPPMMDPTKQAGFPAPLFPSSLPGAPWIPQTANAQGPSATSNVQALQEHYENKRAELRQLEQLEVIEGERQGPAWRTSMIAKKRSLIIELDAVRKQINTMKEVESKEMSANDAGQTTTGPAAPSAPVTAPSAFGPPFQPPLPQPVFSSMGVPYVSTPSPFQLMYPTFGPTAPPSFSAEAPQFGLVPDMLTNGGDSRKGGDLLSLTNGQQAGNGQGQPPKSSSPLGLANRRSHAVPIKKPEDDNKKAGASRLDPKSPTYEPVSKMTGTNGSGQNLAPSTPSPAKTSPWNTNGNGSAISQLLAQKDRLVSQKPSLSSIDTTDFFPTNTHEHSSTRIAPEKLSKQPSLETTKVPATPDKPWANGPWNPPSGSQSSRAGNSTQIDPTLKLTSWPEVFGKQSPIPGSGRRARADGAPSSSTAMRTDTGGRNSADLNWPGIASEPVAHPPATYQEGFQAGLSHTGLPEAADVLRGYVAGLLTFLDTNAKGTKDGVYSGNLFANKVDREASSARSSLRGYFPGTLSHDSGVSFTENMRSGKVPSPHLGQTPVYSPRANEHNVPMTFAQGLDAARDLFSQAQGSLRASNVDAYRQRVPSVHAPLSQPFSGNQMGNRPYGTPTSMQRFFPAPKEMSSEAPKMETPRAHAIRSSGRQRLSGLDGALDDLEGLMMDTPKEDKGAAGSSDSAEADASCFKPSCGKGKQAASTSTMSHTGSTSASKPASPKKGGEHSPAKARLEQVTSKLRRPRKEDLSAMSAEEKQKRTEKWGKRFRQIKAKEEKDIERYLRENPRRDSEEGPVARP